MNKFRLVLILAAIGLATQQNAHALYSGISFTAAERAAHEAGVDQITQTAAACLQRSLAHHYDFYRKYGFSPYYGDRGSFGKLSYYGKQRYLRDIGKNSSLLSQMEPISCVELALNCLGEGFKSAGQADLWARLRAFTIQHDVDGTALQHGLQQLGWKILYWNPDVRMNREWDYNERRHNPSNSDRFWGYHEEYWRSARSGSYLYNRVDDVRQLVNFGESVPAFLKPIPFFVGTAHGGYHVFPGTFGQVVEAHSTRRITDPKSLESEPFNPLAGEAPTGGMYHSGLIAVPGKYLQ